jgi:hypothetical protein
MSNTFEMFEGYLHTWRCSVERSKEALCTRSDISHCGKEKFQVPSVLNKCITLKGSEILHWCRVTLDTTRMYQVLQKVNGVMAEVLTNFRSRNNVADWCQGSSVSLVSYQNLHNNLCPLICNIKMKVLLFCIVVWYKHIVGYGKLH